MRELLTREATELAALVRSGEVGARELTEEALAAIDEVDPQINAFVHIDAERALAAAEQIKPGDERPFAGVPTAVKDIAAMVEGMPFTCGSRLFGDFIAPIDTAVVRRMRNAGMVILGRTNTPEFGILPVTEPVRFGATRNPVDTSRTPGGSSGGAAAAVAAGMLPIAHGTDGAGSLRIPAACCGLVGLKPARNRVSGAPTQAENHTGTQGFIARSVADAAAGLDVLAGREPGDANWAPPPTRPFHDSARHAPGRLRIGVTTTPTVDLPVDSHHLAVVDTVAGVLAGLGHDVAEVDLGWTDERMLELFVESSCVSVAAAVTSAARVSGLEPSLETIESLTYEFWRRGTEVLAVDHAQIENQLKAFAGAVATRAAEFDAILTPVLNQRPVMIGQIDATQGMDAFDRSVEFTSFTAVVNQTGLPAISLPAGVAPDGLPLAVQLIGGPAGEAELLALAAQLEAAIGT